MSHAQSSQTALVSLQNKHLTSLTNLANNRKIWLNLRDMMPYPYTMDNAKSYFEMVHSHETQRNRAIEYQGAFVGMIGVHPQSDIYRRSAELGYWVGEPYWGKGIATEAVKLICRYAFDNFEINRLYAGVFSHNKASMRVLEKAGFEKEGVLKSAIIKDEQVWDEVRYGRLS